MPLIWNIDRLGAVFDDESLVADAGLLATATLMNRLGLEELVDRTVRLGGGVGGAGPGRKVLTLVAAMLAGGSHIDHVDRLRAASTGAGVVPCGDGSFRGGSLSAFVHLGSHTPVGGRC